MTKREIYRFVDTLGPPGFILNFTKQTLEDFIFDLVGLELEDYQVLGKSNGKRLTALLVAEPRHVTTIVEALTKIQKEDR